MFHWGNIKMKSLCYKNTDQVLPCNVATLSGSAMEKSLGITLGIND